jgi:hypothetical protein
VFKVPVAWCSYTLLYLLFLHMPRNFLSKIFDACFPVLLKSQWIYHFHPTESVLIL